MTPLSIAAIGWVIGSLVSKAVTELLEAWAKRVGLGKEFKTLKDQLLQLNALLTSAHSLHTNNLFLKELVDNLQQLAYKAENLLDELDYYRLEDEIQQKGTQDKVKCSNKSSVASSSSSDLLAKRPLTSTVEGLYARAKSYLPVTLPETFEGLYNMSRRMKELAEELQKSEEKVRYALQTDSLVNISRKPEATNLPQTSPFHTKTREVVGRNKERDELLLNLTNEESATVGEVLVLAIVGCGGVGKTTLAGLVYNDPKLKKCFDIRSWICVSTRFDIDRFTREMLGGACDNKYDRHSNLTELHEKLKDKLESKKFLLVLDDMWEDKDKSQWDNIIALLSNCMVKRAIILVTTRNKSVAKMVDARDTMYLEGLDKDVFLSFFSTCIFNDPNFGGNWRLRDIGQQIANELKGNPLAVKTVSALLKKNSDERYWVRIRDSEEWKSQNGPNDIMPALRLSYEHMPFHLQRCFSYCAIFPEDYPFTREELVYLWMAQGFLDVISEGKRMEDIGSAYFDDLFDRGFFQTAQSTSYDEVCYTFHDLIRDLACVVSFKECLCIDGVETKEIPQTIRHLSIFNSFKMAKSEEQIVTALECLEGENFGTIFNWVKFPFCICRSILDLLKKTKFLRAVRLDLCCLVQLHNCNFQNFVSLRYLRLIMSDFDNCQTLPREICRLYHLEVLEIEDGYLLNELPNNFSDLVSLRHFTVEGKLHSKILRVGKLTSLQELNYFHVQQDNGFEIEQLGSLKEIGGSLNIWGLENVKSQEEANKARLAEKGKLDALYLEWNHGEQENESVLEGLKPNANLKSISIRGYGGVASPRWLDPALIFLESLTLDCCFSCELLPPIGELESLKYLELSRLDVREIGPQCYGTCQSMKFPSLEELKIENMPNLQKWVWSDHLQQFLCFKKLKKLTIQDCPELVDLPLSRSATSEVLERFPSLESLIINNCPLILELPPLPYSSLLSYISIQCTGFIDLMVYGKERQELSLFLDVGLALLKVGELLAFHELSSLHSLTIFFHELSSLRLESFHELSSLHYLHISNMKSFHENLNIPHLRILKISNISSSESLDLHSFVSLTHLEITGCRSLTSLTFGDQLVCLRYLTIQDCPELVDLPLSGSATSEVLERFPFLESLIINDCPLILELPPLPFSSLLSYISIQCTGFIDLMVYGKERQELSLFLDVGLAFLKVGELLAFHELSSLHSLTIFFHELSSLRLESFHELSSLRYLHISNMKSFHENLNIPHLRILKISNISSSESLDLHSFVSLTHLEITGCRSLTSLTFGDQLVCLRYLTITDCKKLSSIKGLKSWVNLEMLYFFKCPSFIVAWDSTSKEIERTELDFSLSLKIIASDFHALLTLPICKQLTSLQKLTAFTKERQVSPQLLTSIDLVDIEGCKKNLQSFPFNLFPSLEELEIIFCNIESLPTSSCTEITDEFKKLTNIKGVHFNYCPLKIHLKLRSDEMVRHPLGYAEMSLSMRVTWMRMGMRTIYEDDDDEDDEDDDDNDSDENDDDDDDDD